MRWLILLITLLPGIASASILGVDDTDSKLTPEVQAKLDTAFTTYYRQPSVAKADTILDIMNSSDVLLKKTSWPVFVGFFTVVFADNKNHVMHWISRNDYNSYAADVLVAALLHAHLKETALIFAQALQWKPEELDHVRDAEDTVDLKKLNVILPGHIDTLWGAFFGSGDTVYVNEIIDVLFLTKLSPSDLMGVPPGHKMEEVLNEDKNLAASSLKEYALTHPLVREAIEKRVGQTGNLKQREMLQQLLPAMSLPGRNAN